MHHRCQQKQGIHHNGVCACHHIIFYEKMVGKLHQGKLIISNRAPTIITVSRSSVGVMISILTLFSHSALFSEIIILFTEQLIIVFVTCAKYRPPHLWQQKLSLRNKIRNKSGWKLTHHSHRTFPLTGEPMRTLCSQTRSFSHSFD